VVPLFKFFFLPFYIITSSPLIDKAHDVHISMCELRFNEETSTFQVSLKIFIDDLEVALKKEGLPSLSLGTPKENADANEIITSYLDKYFKIEMDGKKLPLRFDGKEISEDFQAVWCYLEFKDELTHPRMCKLTNNILLDIFSDQRNIMDIKMNKSHKAYTILSPGQNTWTYTF
jgi:hypothetical protein